LEEIRTGASVKDFKAEITDYTKTITQELLVAGSGLMEILKEEKVA
jgi:DNA topoisomerase-3